eukprot:7808594-Alexandrium_andersonii.AAC.1
MKEYRLIMKHHYLFHMAVDAQFLNPQTVATLSDEDVVGKLSHLCSSAVKGCPADKLPRSVVSRYLRGLGVHWEVHCTGVGAQVESAR